MKSYGTDKLWAALVGRSREGAWIEMLSIATLGSNPTVAPVRERGLKLQPADGNPRRHSRSREGAWIEMLSIATLGSNPTVAPVRERGLKLRLQLLMLLRQMGRSREGAWIEILLILFSLTLLECRSREGAWIEIAGHRR